MMAGVQVGIKMFFIPFQCFLWILYNLFFRSKIYKHRMFSALSIFFVFCIFLLIPLYLSSVCSISASFTFLFFNNVDAKYLFFNNLVG